MTKFNYRTNKPDWFNFIVDTLKEKDNGIIEVINQKYENFWNKVFKLRKIGKECSCECGEVDPYGYCINCWLKNPSPKWEWSFGKRDTFLCIETELKELIIKEMGDDFGLIIATTRGDYWEVLRNYFFNKQDGECPECKEYFDIGDMELHHIIAINNGGREGKDNLQMLCKPCHRKKIIEIYD